jgi:hypothetical protein
MGKQPRISGGQLNSGNYESVNFGNEFIGGKLEGGPTAIGEQKIDLSNHSITTDFTLGAGAGVAFSVTRTVINGSVQTRLEAKPDRRTPRQTIGNHCC